MGGFPGGGVGWGMVVRSLFNLSHRFMGGVAGNWYWVQEECVRYYLSLQGDPTLTSVSPCHDSLYLF